MTKTSRYKGLVLGSFLVPEIDMIFRDGVGASLVRRQWVQLLLQNGLIKMKAFFTSARCRDVAIKTSWSPCQ